MKTIVGDLLFIANCMCWMVMFVFGTRDLLLPILIITFIFSLGAILEVYKMAKHHFRRKKVPRAILLSLIGSVGGLYAVAGMITLVVLIMNNNGYQIFN